jgi:hypothetical protein
MRIAGGLYDYLGVYVNDLLIADNYPEKVMKGIQEAHKFKIKPILPFA